MLKKLTSPPVWVEAGAAYPYSKSLEKSLTLMSKYDQAFPLWKRHGDFLLIPRGLAGEGGEDRKVQGVPVALNNLFVPRSPEQARVVAESSALLKAGQSHIVEAPTGFGKSHPAGTRVIMYDGTIKNVEDVVEGDLLMGPDSTPRTVYGTHKSWSPIYKVTPIKGDPFYCNDVHILSLKCTSTMGGGRTYRKGEITNIELMEYREQSDTFKHMMKLWRAPGIDLPKHPEGIFDPYVVGLYLADGTKDASNLSLGYEKESCLQYLQEKSYCGVVKDLGGQWRVGLLLFNGIRETLMCPTTKERRIPDKYLRNSREARLQLLAGLLDGDGHLVKNTVFEILCKDTSFKEQVLWLSRSLGFAAYAAPTTKGIKSSGFFGTYWRICISGDTDQIPTKILKKQATDRKQKKDHLLTGFKVEYVREDWVYGFGLDGDHLYLLHDFTVTHNTYVGAAIIANSGKKALVILTKEDIKSQWVKAFKEVLGLKPSEIGLIQANKVNVANKKVVLAMVHSISKDGRYPSWVYREFGLVMVDEVHRMGADTFCQAMWLLPAALRVGLSASPYRKDGKDIVFRSQIGPVMVRSEAYPLIPRVMVLSSGAYLPPMQVQAGRTAHIDRMLSKNTVRNRLIASFILKAWKKNRNTVFFSSRIDHLQTMHDILVGVGVKKTDIGFYVGGLSEQDREVAKRKDVVLATYQMCSEATDAPWWDTAILGTPRSDVLQIVGRVLREYEGKCNAGEEQDGSKCPIVLDIHDSALPILRRYAESRLKFYRKLGAPVKRISLEVAA